MRLGLFGSAAPRVRSALAPESAITKRDLPAIMPPAWLVEKARAQGVDPMLEWEAMQQATQGGPAPAPMASAATPQLGMFGGSAKRAMAAASSMKLPAAAPSGAMAGAMAAPMSGIPAAAPTPGMMMRGPQVKAGMQAAAQDQIDNPRPQAPGAYTPASAKPAGLWDEIWADPFTFFATGTNGLDRKYGRAAEAEALRAGALTAEQAKAEQARQVEALRAGGFSEPQIVAFMNNPEEWSKSLGSNVEATNLGQGETRYRGDGGENYVAPKFGFEGASPYAQTFGEAGLQTTYGTMRPQSYAEKTADGTLVETGRHNRATEGIQRLTASRSGDGGSPSYEYKEVNGKLVAINKANPRDIIEIGPAGSGVPAMTPMQKKVDENWAGTLVEWADGGSSDFVKQMSQLDYAIGEMEKAVANPGSVELSGPGNNLFPGGLGRAQFGQHGLKVQQAVEEVAQRNLRAVLGPAFTAKEGEGLIARAYDPSMEEAENLKRVKRLYVQMNIAAQQKTDAMNYYNEHGSMMGYQGHIPTLADFEAALDDEDNEAAKASTPKPQGASTYGSIPSAAQVPGQGGFQWGAPTKPAPQAQAQNDTPPPGIDPEDWKYMDPADKAKFRR